MFKFTQHPILSKDGKNLFIHSFAFLLLILLLSTGKLMSQCSSSNLLKFGTPTYSDGAYAVDIFWGSPPAFLNGMNFSIFISPQAGLEVLSQTYQSVNPNLSGMFSVSGSPIISFSGFDLNNPIETSPLLTGNDLFLFRVTFSGLPGECYSLSFNPTSYLASNGSGTQWVSCTPLNVSSSVNPCFPQVNIAGIIETPWNCLGSTNQGLENVVVEILSGGDVQCAFTTGVEGKYLCKVLPDVDYDVSPIKEDNPMCGVTTSDLLLIQRHILQSDYLVSVHLV